MVRRAGSRSSSPAACTARVSSKPFLGGVEKLLERRPDLRARLRVQFVGRVSADNRRLADAYIAPGRIGDVVSFEGFVPRHVALARMAGADALLQLNDRRAGTEMFVGGKLLEYLGFRQAHPGGDAAR